MKHIPAALIFILLISACNQPASISGKKSANVDSTLTAQKVPVDTAAAFKVGAEWIEPKPSLKFNSVASDNQDTLDLAICADYVYSPFGKVQSELDFGSDLLKNFSVQVVKKNSPEGPLLIHELTHASSKLFFFFDRDPEAWHHSYIIKGEINDSDVILLNGIKIGITINDFYTAFFTRVPENIKNKFQVIVFSSCAIDIKHIYTFKNNRLVSIKFITDTTLKV